MLPNFCAMQHFTRWCHPIVTASPVNCRRKWGPLTPESCRLIQESFRLIQESCRLIQESSVQLNSSFIVTLRRSDFIDNSQRSDFVDSLRKMLEAASLTLYRKANLSCIDSLKWSWIRTVSLTVYREAASLTDYYEAEVAVREAASLTQYNDAEAAKQCLIVKVNMNEEIMLTSLTMRQHYFYLRAYSNYQIRPFFLIKIIFSVIRV